jgi:2-(1,2-epoxy-1,2-dihydrophenyl)acetyl-CoA isomerase
MSTILFETTDHVARITLNRPQAANVIDMALARELLDVAVRCENDASIGAIVLTGAGKNFCFGGDLRGMVESGGDVEAFLKELTTYLHAAITCFTRMNAPVIAAVNGTAAGAGVGLVAMADLALAASSAKFALAYTGVGLTPDGSTSFLLPRTIGRKRAMELFLTNRPIGAEEALDWGLVNQVVPDADLDAAATALAQKLAAGPTRAFGAVKRLMQSADPGLEAQLATEGRMIATQGAGPEGREGIQSFLEKRAAKFR